MATTKKTKTTRKPKAETEASTKKPIRQAMKEAEAANKAAEKATKRKAKAKPKAEAKPNEPREGKDGRKLGKRISDDLVVKGINKYVEGADKPTFWSCVKWFRAKGVGIGHARLERLWNETV